MSFMYSINGQIEWVDVLAGSGTSWHCKYDLVAGTDWKLVGGLEGGVSQTACVVTNAEKVVLNLPIEATYKTTNPFGWPQMVLSVYRDMTLEGYGRVHLPVKPGFHKLNVSLSKPQPSSLLGYMGLLFGYQPELIQMKILATTEGNNLIRMISTGNVAIMLNTLTQGFQDLGYDI